MYNKEAINKLVKYIESYNGIAEKEKLADLVKSKFSLVIDRKVYMGNDFAIRFSQAKSKKMSNTVLSLSALQKYDQNPFIVCIVTPQINYLLLANTTFLKKISHSSQDLRTDNIKGSFNGSDIIMDFEGLANEPINFETLFAFHSEFTFHDNLERLVENTNDIVGRNNRFNITSSKKETILNSISRAQQFINSYEYVDLKSDLDNRVNKLQGEIAIAAFIDNVNIRGRIIEYLITDNGSDLKSRIISALHNSTPLPQFRTEDKLGDYSKSYPLYNTETDIKTKIMFLDSNPKAYNVDKLLEFLSNKKSVYLLYIIGINEHNEIKVRLCSVLDKRLLSATHIIHHWAGRNSRGVAQFIGSALTEILSEPPSTIIDTELAKNFLIDLMDK